jgi:FMN phosphatase YigB (HAD superfamily)
MKLHLQPMIKNVIFDLGGVLLNIDYNLTVEAFKELGVPFFEEVFSKFRQDRVSDDFEKGLISEVEFRTHIRDVAGINYDDESIDRAWNAMLLDFPPSRIEMLKKLKSDGFNLFLLSNTNIIHYNVYTRSFKAETGVEFDSLFTHAYYSHQIGLRKPEKEIFDKVLSDAELQPDETLYIEDSQQHTDVARTLGIQCLLMQTNGDTVTLVNERLAQQNP